ncbi:MAG: hypothetical protein ACLFM1_10175 [Bacteroidales bacterium]
MRLFPARLISWVFHPLLSPLFACILVFLSGHYLRYIDSALIFSILLIFFTITFALPALLLPLLYYQQLIKDLNMPGRKSRPVVYLSTLILYATSSFLMYRFEFPDLLEKLMLSYTILLAVLTMLSLFYKASAHTAAVGSLAGLVLFLSLYYNMDLRLTFSGLILIAGLSGSARIVLRYDNLQQVSAGFLLGFAGMPLLLWIF